MKSFLPGDKLTVLHLTPNSLPKSLFQRDTGIPNSFQFYSSRSKNFLRCLLLFCAACIAGKEIHAQCMAPIAQGSCTGGNGAATNGVNINSGQTFWFTGNSTFSSGVNLNAGGTLRICGNLILSSINLNGGTIIITSSGSLTINGGGTLYLNGNCSIYNFGSLTINRSVTMQNANNLIMNASLSSILNMNTGTYALEINSGTSYFINYGMANINTFFVQGNAATGAVCLAMGSSLNLVNLNNNKVNAFNAPSGQACIGYTGNAAMNASLTSTSSVKLCKASGATPSGGGSFGSATVSSNCSSCSGVLPVNFTKFTATFRPSAIVLNWSTAQETNNSYFSLERSGDTQEWKEVKKISGSPYSNSVSNYQYVDEEPLNGNNYYRLKQVDADGRFQYSQVVMANFIVMKNSTLVYPNPNAGSVLHVRYPLSKNSVLTLSDLNGRILFRSTINSTTVSVPSLLRGTYVLKLQDPVSGQVKIEKYVVE